MQNLIYALIQVGHNFGATAIVAVAAYGAWCVGGRRARRTALLLAALWALQAFTGALFGTATYLFDHHLPDIHGVAVKALFIKMGCAVLGLALALYSAKSGRPLWGFSLLLGLTALGSAAFLRWFS